MNKTLMAVGALVLSGCASTPMTSVEPFQPVSLNELLTSGQYQQKTFNFFVINDSSSSMADKYLASSPGSAFGSTKLAIEKEILSRINQTIPDLKLSAGIRSFGSGACTQSDHSFLNMPLADYSKSAFSSGIDSLQCASGISPMHEALDASGGDLAPTNGSIAVLIQSDGHALEASPVPSVAALKSRYGERLCVYTVWVGNDEDEDGKGLLKSLAESSGCGLIADAAEVSTPAGMADFVKKVFLKPTQPSAAECEGDSDGDGVNDCNDHCADTLKGAHVNQFGCWVVDVKFDNDKSNIKPIYYGELDDAAQVILENPGVTIEVQGHTSNIASAPYNQKLSERRADAVTRYLRNQVGDSATLIPQGYGLTQPIDTNETEEGRANNRRVELKVIR